MAGFSDLAGLIHALEACSRLRPDRVLRLRGRVPAGAGGEEEPLELLVFRGISSSTTHPTAWDPDRSTLPAGALLEEAELLRGPLDPTGQESLAGPLPLEGFLDPAAWL